MIAASGQIWDVIFFSTKKAPHLGREITRPLVRHQAASSLVSRRETSDGQQQDCNRFALRMLSMGGLPCPLALRSEI
jgi:hypothetical protein